MNRAILEEILAFHRKVVTENLRYAELCSHRGDLKHYSKRATEHQVYVNELEEVLNEKP